MLVRKPSNVHTVQIANSNGAYTAGNQIGVPVEITNASEASGAAMTLVSAQVLDPAKTDQGVDLFFFSKQPASAGADKAAATVSAADLAFCLGVVPISTFKDLSAVSVGYANNLMLKLKPIPGATSIWVMAVARGTQNYGGASNLKLQLGIDRD